jgi:glycosyltransferase involved in cell wall biosynthesis
MDPVVSILLPAFNADPTLDGCLRSIRRQTETRWECVLVDDGSTDGTLRLARGHAALDGRLHVVSSGHRGIVAALNTGLAHCRGRYVARMDADDIMHRRRLEEQVRLLEAHPDLAAVGCHVRAFPRRGLGPGYRAYEAWLNAVRSAEGIRRELFVECPLAHPTLVVRRGELEALGYRDAGWPEDYDLVLRLVTGGRRLGVLPRRRLGWRHGPGRLSLTDPVYRAERFAACKAAYLATWFLGGTDRYILWGYGATGRSLGAALAGHGKHPSHVVDVHPGRLGQRIRGAPVVPPEALPGLLPRPLIVSVAGAGPRQRIREALARLGLEDTRDFVCAA